MDEQSDIEAEEAAIQDVVAQKFTVTYAESMRFDHSVGRWYEFDRDHWRRDETQRAIAYSRALSRTARQSASKRGQQVAGTAAFAAGVEKLARSDPIHAVTSDCWDADPMLLGCRRETIDLQTGEARQPDPGDGITKLTAVSPMKVDCPLWLTFLREATGDDASLIHFLQQRCGYCLTGITKEHALLFVYGTGGNGKSVFLNTVGSILGGYAQTAAMDTFAKTTGDRHPTDMAMLHGARLVTVSKTEEGRHWAETRIKALTGGDPVSARFMRQDFFTYRPQFKLTIVGNHMPILHNVDEAARRRFNVVPFTRQPSNPDPDLEERLKAEWPAILTWMIPRMPRLAGERCYAAPESHRCYGGLLQRPRSHRAMAGRCCTNTGSSGNRVLHL